MNIQWLQGSALHILGVLGILELGGALCVCLVECVCVYVCMCDCIGVEVTACDLVLRAHRGHTCHHPVAAAATAILHREFRLWDSHFSL